MEMNEYEAMADSTLYEMLTEKAEGLRAYLAHTENELKLAQEEYNATMAEREAAAKYAQAQIEKSVTPVLKAWYDGKAREIETEKKRPLFPAEDVERLRKILTEKGQEENRLYREILRADLEGLLEGINSHKSLHNATRRQFYKIAAASKYIPETALQITNPEEEAAILRLRFAIEDTLQNLQE